MSSAASRQAPEEQAISAMLEQYRDNPWLTKVYWSTFEPHVRLMIADITKRFPPGKDVRLLDVGCYNGYMSYLFSRLGYSVTGADADDLEDRRAVFGKAGIKFVSANFNELNPFPDLEPNTFDIVIIAQVIEHILNHPLGLLRSIANVMRPGGILILTTPNPLTVMNAMRVFRGTHTLWGTRDFIDEPKIEKNQIITNADIHYREYTHAELEHMLTKAGLRVESSRFLGTGSSGNQSAFKNLIKNNRLTQKLMTKRLLSSNHYFLARK